MQKSDTCSDKDEGSNARSEVQKAMTELSRKMSQLQESEKSLDLTEYWKPMSALRILILRL